MKACEKIVSNLKKCLCIAQLGDVWFDYLKIETEWHE